MKILSAPITALLIVFGCRLIATHVDGLRMTLIISALYSIILLSLAAWIMATSKQPPPRYPYNIQPPRK